ncbi:hypothetical protein BT69DRAFT_950466 [Atractiella rhizophila]|nr:hypothetical protein BT69DRAFT_950466 [Atractiella rhizophila]
MDEERYAPLLQRAKVLAQQVPLFAMSRTHVPASIRCLNLQVVDGKGCDVLQKPPPGSTGTVESVQDKEDETERPKKKKRWNVSRDGQFEPQASQDILQIMKLSNVEPSPSGRN